MRHHHRHGLGWVGGTLLAAAAPAQTQAPALGDIVVTGEKQRTTAQTAPLAITALSGQSLAERNVNELNDLNGYVPGLTIAKSEGAERVIAIRGIGYETAQNPNSQPGVAFHIDGVYIAHVIALDQDLLDVDRVEVLRGPQGTVFGETATGGAINVITHKPVLGEASGTASISGGNHAYVKATATANIPVSPTVAARASIQYLSHAGYGHATAVPGGRPYPLDDANNLGARAAILWQPSDRITTLLETQLFRTDRNAAEQKDVTDPDPDPRRVTQDYPGRFQLTTAMTYLTLSADLGRAGTLKSVSAWQYLDKHQSVDNDRLANPAYFDNITRWQDRSTAVTEEVSLASDAKARLAYNLGGFALRQHARQAVFETASPAVAALTLANGTPVKFQTDSPYQHSALAAYGQATWHVTPRLGLVAGARYNWDRITAQPFQLYQAVAPRAASSRAVTGKLGADWRFGAASMVYLTASRGYKPSGLSFGSGGVLVPTSYKKETVDAAEIGTKNDLFGGLARLNLSAYHYWYRDFQFTAEDPVPYAGGTANIPHARIYGLEVEGALLPLAGLRFDGTLSLARGRFRGDYRAIDAQTAATVRTSEAAAGLPNPYDPRVIAAVTAAAQDTDGNRVPKLPGVQGQGSVSYAWSVPGGRITLQGEAVYRGAFNYRLFAVPAFDRVPAYTLFNAFASFQPERGAWTFSVSALNLTNKAGINARFANPYGSGTTSLEYVAPRQLFGTLAFRW